MPVFHSTRFGTRYSARRGRYGLNTAIVLIAFVAIAIVLNFVIYWAVGRPDPPGFLRVDTTSTKQFIVSDADVQHAL